MLVQQLPVSAQSNFPIFCSCARHRLCDALSNAASLTLTFFYKLVTVPFSNPPEAFCFSSIIFAMCAITCTWADVELNEAGPDIARGPHVLISSFDETWLMWNIYLYTYTGGKMKSRLVHTQNMRHTPPQGSPKGTFDFGGQESRVSCPLRFFY